MAPLKWHAPGSKVYETGIDRGGLNILGSSPVVWNGLTGVDESPDIDVTPYYLDGVKSFERTVVNDFAAKLTAFTYPDEFDQCLGVARSGGLLVHNQKPKRFNLSWRTRLGNDLEGDEAGYRIHFLYNVLANPESISFNTVSDQASLTEFGWDLTTVPTDTPGFKPTAHLSISSAVTDPETFALLEEFLYGTDTQPPAFPTFEELLFFGAPSGNDVLIIDHGDGRWSAVGSAANVQMLSATQFQVNNVDAVMLDSFTYRISTTDNP